MIEIARSGSLHLYETTKGFGILVNKENKFATEEKSIVSLLSASDDWEPVEEKFVILEKARSHKYIRRLGMKGNYTYIYEEPKGESNLKPYQIPLAAEAIKYNTFEEFERAFLGEIKHGRYWHITDDPNFTIDKLKGPRDMSSMASGKMSPGQLMITSDLPHWASEYPDRKYVAEINMSEVPKEAYKQINRGFGNEFFVSDPSKAKVVKVVTKQTALSDSRQYDQQKPGNQEELKALFLIAHQHNKKLVEGRIIDKIEDIDSAKPNDWIILYHGTTVENARRIEKEGFKPDLAHNWKVKSKKGYTYFSYAYAPFYAGAAESKEKERAIVKVKIQLKDLYPEDDFIMVALGRPVYTQKQIDSIDLEDYKKHTKTSLKTLGNAAVKDPSKVNVLSVGYFDASRLLMVSDPSIVPINFLIMHDYYKNLSEHLATGGTVDNAPREAFPGIKEHMKKSRDFIILEKAHSQYIYTQECLEEEAENP